MAWPTNFIDREWLTPARLNQWALATQSWGGDVNANNSSLAPIGLLITPFVDVTLAIGLNQNIIATGRSCIRIVGPTGAFSVGGFSGGVDGQWLSVYNSVMYSVTFLHQSAGSAAVNRINSASNVDLTVRSGTPGRSSMTFRYHGGESRWIPIFAS
jgi:hypothetical protein